TLSDLDLGVLTSKKNSFETELAKWDSEKSKVAAKLATYRVKLQAVTDFIAAHPSDYADAESGKYLELITALKTEALALSAAHSDTIAFFTNVNLKFEDLKSEQEYTTRLAKQKLGLSVDKVLVPEKFVKAGDPSELSDAIANEKALKEQILTLNPSGFSKVLSGASDIVKSLAEFEFAGFRESGQYSSFAQNGVFFFFGNLNQVNGVLNSASSTISSNASAWVAAREGRDVPLDALAGNLNSLNDRVVFYKPGSAPNQIGQNDLSQIVSNLRNFLLEKQLLGQEFNPVLGQIVEAAGAFTDQIENIKFLQANQSISLPESKARLAAAEEAKSTLQEVAGLTNDIAGLLASKSSSGSSLYTDLSKVELV
ncbi:hypothetical protein CH379_019930, partial [Leptospira ellisii]|nr:hypothetical protein [Leptospira ellisii]